MPHAEFWMHSVTVLTHQQSRNTFRLRFSSWFELKSRGTIRAQFEICKETDASG